MRTTGPPRDTADPEYTSSPGFLVTGSDSPVSADSSASPSPILLFRSSSAAGPAIRPPAAMTFLYCSFRTGSLGELGADRVAEPVGGHGGVAVAVDESGLAAGDLQGVFEEEVPAQRLAPSHEHVADRPLGPCVVAGRGVRGLAASIRSRRASAAWGCSGTMRSV